MSGTKPLPRRRFLRLAGEAGIAVAAAGFSGTSLVGCSRGSDDTLKVGVIAPFSGPSASIGALASASLDAAVRHLNATGGLEGRKAEVLLRDAGAEPQTGQNLFSELAAQPDVLGVLWCGAAGFDQVSARMGQEKLPVVVVFDDPFSQGLLPTPARGSSLFQMQPPAIHLLDALADYATNDRGYASAALFYDADLDPDGVGRRLVEESFTRAGIEVQAVEGFASDTLDFAPQLQRVQGLAPDLLFIDGLPESAADLTTALAEQGASYVDTPTAKGPEWHPHIFGSPRTLDLDWADLAGEAAKVGTVTGGHLGGLTYLPAFAIGSWMNEHLGKDPVGGEELPADALATLLRGVEKAGTTDRQRVIEAIEGLGSISFASTAFSYAGDRHVAHRPEDTVVLTLERLRGPAPTDPPYELGREWNTGGLYSGTAATFTQLVRPTLEANRRSHPELVAEILAESYGTQCTKMADESLTSACKIH